MRTSLSDNVIYNGTASLERLSGTEVVGVSIDFTVFSTSSPLITFRIVRSVIHVRL